MKVLIMLFSPASYYLTLFRANILLSTLFSNILSLCSSLNIGDQASHTYKTTGKIIALYIYFLSNNLVYEKMLVDIMFNYFHNLFINSGIKRRLM
jgi:hypothetical protein